MKILLDKPYYSLSWTDFHAPKKSGLSRTHLYKDVALNKKPPITKENLRIFFFVIGGVECIKLHSFAVINLCGNRN